MIRSLTSSNWCSPDAFNSGYIWIRWFLSLYKKCNLYTTRCYSVWRSMASLTICFYLNISGYKVVPYDKLLKCILFVTIRFQIRTSCLLVFFAYLSEFSILVSQHWIWKVKRFCVLTQYTQKGKFHTNRLIQNFSFK